MARTIDADVPGSRPDLLAYVVRIALVVYLSPVILAVFSIGFLAIAVVHLAAMTAFLLPHAHRVATRPIPAALSSGIVGSRAGGSILG